MNEPFPTPQALLKKHSLSAKKSWGQNFLNSPRVYRAIVDATVRDDVDWIVEIGAGLGTLTMRLAERVAEGKVIALERDPDMVDVLRKELEHLDNVEIVAINALRYDLVGAAKWQGSPISVCGNLPYQIASQLLFHILAARPHISRAVVMLQKEMADRILAGPGSKTYGALTVMIQSYADVKRVIAAPRKAFVPPPKVDSTVIVMRPNSERSSALEIENEELHSKVVHAAFGQRRKTLRNSLGSVFGKDVAESALSACSIDAQRRAETLDLAEYAALTRAFEELT